MRFYKGIDGLSSIFGMLLHRAFRETVSTPFVITYIYFIFFRGDMSDQSMVGALCKHFS